MTDSGLTVLLLCICMLLGMGLIIWALRGFETEVRMPEKKHKCECHEELEWIGHILQQILWAIKHPLPTGGTFSKIGDDSVTGNQVTPGVPSIFQAVLAPAGAVLPAADKLTAAASDPSVGIAPSPDGDPLKVQVTVPSGSTLTSFQLAGQFTGPDFPTPVNMTAATITVVPAAAPLPTGGTWNQLS